MNIKLDEDVVLDVSDEALELALKSAVNTPWAELAGGQGGIQLLTLLMRRSQPTDRVRLLRVVGTHSWAELAARRSQGAFTQLLTLLMRRSRLLLTGNPHLLGRGYSTLESAMNIELDEVVVLHVSDDALEQAAGGGQGGIQLLTLLIRVLGRGEYKELLADHRIRLLRVVGTLSWEELAARRFQGR